MESKCSKKQKVKLEECCDVEVKETFRLLSETRRKWLNVSPVFYDVSVHIRAD